MKAAGDDPSGGSTEGLKISGKKTVAGRTFGEIFRSHQERKAPKEQGRFSSPWLTRSR